MYQIKLDLREIVEKIFQKNTGYAEPEHAINQAESLKSLSTDLYTDSRRFIYELLQNADDSSIENAMVQVGIRLFDNILVVAHTGKSFDYRDIRGICGVSDGTKKNLVEKTGYKGIGFKAVFGQSNKVVIFSDGEYFRFDSSFNFGWNTQWGEDQSTWERENERKFLYPWQIIPIYTESNLIDQRVRSFLNQNRWKVATIIQLANKDDVKQSLEQLSENVNMFLFLKNISELDFNIGHTNIISLHRSNKTNSIKIIRNESIVANWVLRTVKLAVPQEVKQKLIEERNIPDKLLNAKETELTLAAKLREDGLEVLEKNERLLYSYLPTEESRYSIPVLVNSSFVIGANRESLHEDSKWNQWLFKTIPFELLKWIAELVTSEFQYQAYRLIPEKINIYNELGTAYDEGLSKAFDNIPFLLSEQQELLKISQAIVDFTFLSRKSFITEDVVRKFVIRKLGNSSNKIHSNPFLPYTGFERTLKNIGVASFEWDDVSKFLESDIFLRSHTSLRDTQLIHYFKQLCEAENPKNINDSVVKNWSFILDHKGLLHRPTNIYFPTPDDINWNDPNSEISFLHEDIQNWLLENPEIRNWLEHLGVIEKTDLSYLKKTIIENASTYSTHENSIPTILTIFSLYAKRAIGKEELSKLSELKILTMKGTLLAAKSCYLSDAYSPRLRLESVLEDDIFVSDQYMKNQSEREEWRRFFKMMEVKEGIVPVKYGKESKSVLIDDYLFLNGYFQESDKKFQPYINTFTADTFADLIKPIFLPKTHSYYFSKLFWNDLIHNEEVYSINTNAVAFWGNYGKHGRENGSEVRNYLKWYIQNNSCIPTVMECCFDSNSVFINSEDILKISGNYLPVFDGGELSSDWKAFLNFKTNFELSDYLLLLSNIIADRTENDRIKIENNERIQLIYEWFLNSCTNFSEDDISKIKEWSEHSFLPDRQGNIFPCHKLNFYMDGDSSIFQGEFPFIFINAINRKHRELETLLQLFNVKILRHSEFKLNHSEIEELVELKNRLKTVLPYLVKWLEKNEQGDLSDRISTLKLKIDNLKIFISDNLEISYEDNWKKSVQVHFDSSTLYITTPWNSNKVMLNLPEQLCRYLDIKGYEKELEFLLRVEDTTEIEEYFKQEGIKIPQSSSTINFTTFDNKSGQIDITKEILASLGISTSEELEARLKDSDFSKSFIHFSTPSYEMFQYAKKLIDRAKRNIIAYLDTLEEYDCSDYETLAADTVLGITKNGKEIVIVVRPSDNNEVIIYYPSEFSYLEDAPSELWYENGIDTPQMLTLGKILKVTGINRIPL